MQRGVGGSETTGYLVFFVGLAGFIIGFIIGCISLGMLFGIPFIGIFDTGSP